MITLSPTPGQPYAQPWRNAIAVGRAFDLLRQDLLDHLRQLQKDVGFHSCRFHAVFDDDMQVVLRQPDGSLAFQWRFVDQAYDALLAMGLKPFVELNPMPSALASGTQQMFWYKMNVTPPKVMAEWDQLIEAFVRHLIDRYGSAEVRTWWFEVWNEPNLGCFWSGSKEDYFALYDASARAVKRVDPLLRIGGPASSKAYWLEDLIRHCDATGTPLDFVSSHLYPQDEYVDYQDRKGSPHAPGAFFAATIAEAVRKVHALRPGLPVHWTEWNAMSCHSTASIDWCNNATNDQLHGAAFAARTCVELDGSLDTLCWWVASDIFSEGGIPRSAFSMTYGLMTIHGIPKAAYHAFAFLRRLRGGRLAVSGNPPAAAGLAATRDGAAVHAVAWNQRLLEEAAPAAWDDRLRVPVQAAGDHLVLCARVGPGAGSAYERWLAMGAPHDLPPTVEDALRAMAQPAWSCDRLAAKDGVIEVPLRLAPGEILYLEVRPVGQRAFPRSTDPASMATWNAGMGEQSR
ncbi:MAG TPA: hypothetical protein DCS97_06610 [Planctomycetes bacterium]|nr:hypothetical protein [Planctomycetota bacterium]